MAISDTDVKAIYTGDGSNVTFAIPFDYTNASEVTAILRDETSSTITETTWVNPTNYSISGANIVATTAPTTLQKVLVKRTNPLTQTLTLLGTGEFNVAGLNEELDKLTRLVQEIDEKVKRCIKLPVTYPTALVSDLIVPEPTALASLRWTSAKDALENVTYSSTALASPLTAKGDLLAYNGSAAVARAVGSNGQFLRGDSSQASGLGYSGMWEIIRGWRPQAAGPQLIEDTAGSGIWVWKFEDAIQQKISTFWRVPAYYVAGRQINLKGFTYTTATSLTTLLKSTATLIPSSGSTAWDSTTNQRASTNSAITAASPSKAARVQTCDLTDSNGAINSVSVAAGDYIRIDLERDFANDTDTADMRLVNGVIGVEIA